MTVERCRYRYDTERYPDLGSGCCWRPVWNGTERCIWHAEEQEKPLPALVAPPPEPGDRLDRAVLSRTALDDADWLTRTVLVDVDFRDVTAENADFSGADLRNADFENASLRGSSFRGANLEDAVLRDADLAGTDFEDARLHEVDFSLSYMGRETTFGETVAYERELIEADDPNRRRALFDAATRTYRTLQYQFRQNALLERTEEFFVREKDLRRRFAWSEGEHLHAIRAEASRWMIGYGFSIRGILATSFFVIVFCGLLYPFVGGVREPGGGSATTYALDSPLEASATELVSVLPESLYFSLISFTTLGAGDVLPNGTAVRALSSLQALLGFALLALLISVLARRQYWL